jgi:hypothetical protein
MLVRVLNWVALLPRSDAAQDVAILVLRGISAGHGCAVDVVSGRFGAAWGLCALQVGSRISSQRNGNGYREILALQVSAAEDEAGWLRAWRCRRSGGDHLR